MFSFQRRMIFNLILNSHYNKNSFYTYKLQNKIPSSLSIKVILVSYSIFSFLIIKFFALKYLKFFEKVIFGNPSIIFGDFSYSQIDRF